MDFAVLDSTGAEHDVWPPATAAGPDEPEPRLAALRLRISTEQFDVERVWTTPQPVDYLKSRSEDPFVDTEEADEDEPPPDDADADLIDEDF